MRGYVMGALNTLREFRHQRLPLLLGLVVLFSTTGVNAHSGSVTNAAWDACHSKSLSTACEYTGFHDERYRGTCQAMSGHLMCVRNQPVEKLTTDTHPVSNKIKSKK